MRNLHCGIPVAAENKHTLRPFGSLDSFWIMRLPSQLLQKECSHAKLRITMYIQIHNSLQEPVLCTRQLRQRGANEMTRAFKPGQLLPCPTLYVVFGYFSIICFKSLHMGNYYVSVGNCKEDQNENIMLPVEGHMLL